MSHDKVITSLFYYLLILLCRYFYVNRFEFSLNGLFPAIVIQETTSHKIDRSNEVRKPDTSDGDVIPQSFTTNIDELNLLGEVGQEKSSYDFNSTRNDCEFRIDKLNLWFFFFFIRAKIVCKIFVFYLAIDFCMRRQFIQIKNNFS